MTIVFADRGLHLGVLGALLTRGAITEPQITAIVESTGPDGPDDGYPGPGPRLAASLQLLHALPLPSDATAAIDQLDFDGGNEIYMVIEQTLDIDTGGETGDYNVTSLEGIDRLRALRYLSLDGHGYHPAPLDLTPLAGLPSLEKLVLTGTCTATAALESLPALRELDTTLARVDDPDVLTRLEARGVTVRLRRRP